MLERWVDAGAAGLNQRRANTRYRPYGSGMNVTRDILSRNVCLPSGVQIVPLLTDLTGNPGSQKCCKKCNFSAANINGVYRQ